MQNIVFLCQKRIIILFYQIWWSLNWIFIPKPAGTFALQCYSSFHDQRFQTLKNSNSSSIHHFAMTTCTLLLWNNLLTKFIAVSWELLSLCSGRRVNICADAAGSRARNGQASWSPPRSLPREVRLSSRLCLLLSLLLLLLLLLLLPLSVSVWVPVLPQPLPEAPRCSVVPQVWTSLANAPGPPLLGGMDLYL